MTMLSIRDLDQSADESGYDSDPGAKRTIETQERLFSVTPGGSAAPLSSIKPKTNLKLAAKARPPELETLAREARDIRSRWSPVAMRLKDQRGGFTCIQLL